MGRPVIRTLTLAFSLLVLASVSVFAQSGRRIAKPAPTPTPIPEGPQFSESTSKPKRPVWIKPSLRRSVEAKAAETKPIADATPDSPDGEIRLETNLITIPVSVSDRNGLYISGLQKKDFKVFENGKEQEISYFGTSEKPFTVILLLDTSPSTEYRMDDIQAAATAFVDQLKPEDRVMVIEFDENVHVLTEPTGDRSTIYQAIRRADFGGGTSLYDAVDFSLRKRLSRIEGRKAIVLFTDGVDTTSHKANYDSTLGLAEESDSLIFPIYYNTFFDNNQPIATGFPNIIFGGGRPRGTRSEDYVLGRKYLEDIADYTGGRVFRPDSTPGGLTAAFEGIAEELRRQYQLGYIPSDEGKPGERRTIKVRVDRPGLAVRARDSYVIAN